MDNKYDQQYSYNNNQYYQDYSNYYSNWGYDQNTGDYSGYNYNQYDYSNQVGLGISSCRLAKLSPLLVSMTTWYCKLGLVIALLIVSVGKDCPLCSRRTRRWKNTDWRVSLLHSPPLHPPCLLVAK